ncbi:MAG: hypothetical protein MUF61_02000 [archaeon]|jgi:hypothetical protein|nr:hypothetical protein [archaeon]
MPKGVELEGRFDFEPAKMGVSFLPQYKRKPRSSKEAAKKGIVAKKNISQFYSGVYAALFGGKVGRVYKGDVEKLASGRAINFHPDIINDLTSGRIYTEVKCTSAKALQYLCSVDQAANYCFKLLQRIEKGDESPGVNYAFFRYGKHDEYGWKKMHNEELERRLCDVNSLVIAPLNMALFLFLTCPRIIKYQESSDSNVNQQEYFKLRGGLFSSLARSKKTLQEVLDSNAHCFGVLNNLTPDDFFVGDLQMRRFNSSPVVVNNKLEIEPFKVSQYYLPNGKAREWLEHFMENHGEILRALDVRDLFAEELEHRKVLLELPF